jgi:hypothetical protein
LRSSAVATFLTFEYFAMGEELVCWMRDSRVEFRSRYSDSDLSRKHGAIGCLESIHTRDITNELLDAKFMKSCHFRDTAHRSQ